MRLFLLLTIMLLFSILTIGQANNLMKIASENRQQPSEAHISEDALPLTESDISGKGLRSNNTLDSVRTYSYPTELDSVKQNRRVFQYTGNEETEIEYSWNSEEMDWELANKYFHVFDDAGHLLEFIIYDWDEDNSEWIPNLKMSQEFNEYGLATSFIQYFWDEANNEWTLDYGYTYEYNVDQLTSSVVHREWSEESGSVEIDYKKEYDYTDFDSISEIITYAHNGDVYNLDEKEERFYNDNQYLTQKTVSWWDSVLELWQFDNKWEYSYNSDMLITEREQFSYNPATFEWNEDALDEYSYNEDNLVSALLQHEWNDDAGAYEVDTKQEWYYNDTLVTTYIVEVYDSNSDGLVNFEKEEYAFNANHQETLSAEYEWDMEENEWIPMIKTTTQYNEYGDELVISEYYEDEATGNWELNSREFFYYDMSTNIAENVQNSFNLNVYPNPARNHVNLSASFIDTEDMQVAIYNQAGEELFSKRLENYSGKQTIHWNTAEVPAGIYVAEFLTTENRYTRKIVVE